ncbi:MAG: lactate racemase domain-containing protein [Promethearchaeota archaeon]
MELPVLPKHTLIVVNDLDRSTPSKRIIQLLRQAKRLIFPAQFIIATGTHTPPNEDQVSHLINMVENDSLLIHDCDSRSQMEFWGITSRKTEVWVEKVVKQAPAILTINSVEPHYFAGYTGGVKSIIPGLASRETVIQNHRWAMDPQAKILSTDTNPVFKDLWEALRLGKNPSTIHTIQVVNDADEIYCCKTGTLFDTFQKVKEMAIKIFAFELTKPVDHLISLVAPPLDRTLYQAQKALENVKHVIKDGGTLVMVAECANGIGNPLFFNRMQELSTPGNVLDTLTFDSYQFGDHKAKNWSMLAKRVNLEYVGNLSENDVKTAFMQKIPWTTLHDQILQWIAEGESILLDTAGGFVTLHVPMG